MRVRVRVRDQEWVQLFMWVHTCTHGRVTTVCQPCGCVDVGACVKNTVTIATQSRAVVHVDLPGAERVCFPVLLVTPGYRTECGPDVDSS